LLDQHFTHAHTLPRPGQRPVRWGRLELDFLPSSVLARDAHDVATFVPGNRRPSRRMHEHRGLTTQKLRQSVRRDRYLRETLDVAGAGRTMQKYFLSEVSQSEPFAVRRQRREHDPKLAIDIEADLIGQHGNVQQIGPHPPDAPNELYLCLTLHTATAFVRRVHALERRVGRRKLRSRWVPVAAREDDGCREQRTQKMGSHGGLQQKLRAAQRIEQIEIGQR
jgi:hypothetical protein